MSADSQVIPESMWSVCYRTNKPTIEDYDEAIQELELAKVDLRWKRDGFAIPTCFVCEDSGHTAEGCHHNPLLLAREWAKATSVWQCWHCGFIATNSEEAVDHFGRSDGDAAKCLVSAAVEDAVKAERARIVALLKEEADLTPCSEDAMVTRSNARLIEADFSYEEAERLAEEEEA